MSKAHIEFREFLAATQKNIIIKERFGSYENKTKNVFFPSNEKKNQLLKCLTEFLQSKNKEEIYEKFKEIYELRDLMIFISNNEYQELINAKFIDYVYEIYENNEYILFFNFIGACIDKRSPFIDALSNQTYNIVLKIHDFLKTTTPGRNNEIRAAIECLIKLIDLNDSCINQMIISCKMIEIMIGRASADLNKLYFQNGVSTFQDDIKTIVQLCSLGKNSIFRAQQFVSQLILCNSLEKEQILDALTLLASILRRLVPMTEYYNSPRILNRLLNLLSIDDNEIRENVLLVINQLSCGRIGPINYLLNNGLLSMLYQISQSMDDNLNVILSIVANISSYSSDIIEMVCNNNFLSIIIGALEEGTITDQVSASWLASNIIYKGTPEQISLLFNQTIFDALLMNLESDDERLGFVILDSLYNGLTREKELGRNDLSNILCKMNFVQLFESIAYSENNKNSRIAHELLNIFIQK